jgi:hypothetical protein
MKYLENRWLRVLVSVILGACCSESVDVFSGNPNRPDSDNYTLLYAVVIFVFITIFIRRRRANSIRLLK